MSRASARRTSPRSRCSTSAWPRRPARRRSNSALTYQGQALGTPDFIAPEQILDAQSADIRSDIYSLGGTLYYLLAGRPPFQANSLYDIYQAHISQDASRLNLVRPEVPTELAALVAKMMAKDPARRFQTPSEVAAALIPLFKTAGSQPSRSSAELPCAVSRIALTPTVGVAPAPAQAPPPLPAVSPPGPKSLKTGMDGVAWQSLIEIKEDEHLGNATNPKPAESKSAPAEGPVRRRPWMWPAILAAPVLGILALGAIIFVATDNGRIKIVVNGPQPAVAIDGKTVRIEGLDEPIMLRVGQHKLGSSGSSMREFDADASRCVLTRR